MNSANLKQTLYKPASIEQGVHEESMRPYSSSIVYVQIVPDDYDEYLKTRSVNPLFNRPVNRNNVVLGNCFAMNTDLKLSSLGVYCAARLMLSSPLFFAVPGLLTLCKVYQAACKDYWEGGPYTESTSVENKVLNVTKYKTTEYEHECRAGPSTQAIFDGLQHQSIPLDPYNTLGEIVQDLLELGSIRSLESKLISGDIHPTEHGVRLAKELGKSPSIPLVLTMRRSPFPGYGVSVSVAAGIPPIGPMSAHICADLANIAKTVQSIQIGEDNGNIDNTESNKYE